ncbi:VWA domain-containing protein [Actinacidiphila sp. bgisy145]|uniref:VWA domain-containing protein n=1 Tax=Actinacidiphila sp. bgisy145 TaxID=3413792 RepID=UPI003EBAF069
MAGAISLTPGGNTSLDGDAARAEVTATGTPVDVSAVLLTEQRKVRADSDLVFYNHPVQDGVSVQGRAVTVELARVPAAVQTVAVVVSVDADAPGTVFGSASGLGLAVTSGARVVAFEPPPCRLGETVVVLAEFYRRAGAWKVRAVGQGYADGLAGLARDFGVSVDDEPAAAAPPAPPTVPDAVLAPPTLQMPSPAQGFGPPPSMPPAPQAPQAPPAPPTGHGSVPPPPAWAPPVPPAPPAAHPAAPAQPVPPAGAPAPAISLEKVQQAAPALVNLYKQAGISLQKKGITGQRAAVYLVLDHSASMKSYYRSGTMQHLAEQVLGLSANLDDDGVVPVVVFGSQVNLVSEISLDNHSGRIDQLQKKLPWGGTCYSPAMRAVIDHYQQCGATDPAFVVFQTDGEPFDRGETKRLLQQSCTLPIFWQFVGFGSPRGLKFLQGLDTLKGRTIDNAGFFAAGREPRNRDDAELYDLLMAEFPKWLSAARAARIIR